MTMAVVPNADGTFTVECGEEKVTVGGSPPPPRARQRNRPIPNDGGAVAYLRLGVNPQIVAEPFDSPITKTPQELLAEAAPNARISVRRNVHGTQVFIQAEPGTPLDLGQIQQAVGGLIEGIGPVDLYIYVDRSRGAPLNISVVDELI